ncbi:MAG: sialidase family protein [Blastocatellia bacterium]
MKKLLLPSLIFALVSLALGSFSSMEKGGGLIAGIERIKLHDGRNGSPTWFIPRAAMIPGRTGSTALMVMQTIAGSDYYGPVHWRASTDRGATWTDPQPVPGLGRRPYKDDIEEAVSDVVPQFHPRTKRLLAIGEIIYYRNGRYFPEQPQRYPIYLTRDEKGVWSERRKLEWNDSRGSAIYAAGSSQYLFRGNGDLLLPLSFRPVERPDYAVTTLLCGFDGRTLTVKRTGRELNNTVKRGLLEPQLTFIDGRYLLTIRAEDGYGYVSASPDGLHWGAPAPWRWDDGEPLAMSTTQQHWVTHSHGLFLAYMRRAEANANVMRWRAPLYLAEVDRKTLRLIRSTERIVFPLIGDGIDDPTHVAHYGNFHVTDVAPDETWITCGEVIPANFRGDLLLARIRWARSNRLVK